MKIGVQLFTVRREAQKDLFGTLSRLSRLGIKYIEAARIPFDSVSAEAFNKANGELGTEVVSTQIKFHVLDESFHDIVKFHETVGCSRAIISVLPTEYIIGKDGELESFAAKADALAARYFDKGITLSDHHHDFEFLKSGSGASYDIIVGNTRLLKFVLDTYWLTKSGIAPCKLIKSLAGRIEGLHLRDYALIRRFVSRYPKDFALGEGVVDFAEIIGLAEEQGIYYGAIEQNTKLPFAELEKSVARIYKLGYKDFLN
jgi:sugar phosphate isomerase/epimerase